MHVSIFYSQYIVQCPCFLSVAAITHCPQCREERFYFISFQVIVYCQWKPAGSWREELKQRPWRNSICRLLSTDCSACFCIQLRTIKLRLALPTVIWARPHQSSIKKMSQKHAHVPILPGDTILCQLTPYQFDTQKCHY